MKTVVAAAAATLLVFLGFFYAPKLAEGLGGDALRISYVRLENQMRAQLGWPLAGQPDLPRLSDRLTRFGASPGAPVLVRIYKREFELELWLQRDGRFQRFATYPICQWSGALGPKLQEGDGQSPEGFYSVDPSALNPNSSYHRAFNVGFPNAFDAANGRTGSLIMVHGNCVSIGCYAMTDPQIDEIWNLVTAAFARGQKRFQVQIFPFRMTGDALEKRAADPSIAFWRDLKIGSDLFEASGTPPKVSVCDRRYHFEPGGAGDAITPVNSDSCGQQR